MYSKRKINRCNTEKFCPQWRLFTHVLNTVTSLCDISLHGLFKLAFVMWSCQEGDRWEVPAAVVIHWWYMIAWLDMSHCSMKLSHKSSSFCFWFMNSQGKNWRRTSMGCYFSRKFMVGSCHTWWLRWFKVQKLQPWLDEISSGSLTSVSLSGEKKFQNSSKSTAAPSISQTISLLMLN